MDELTKEEVLHVAHLARINVSDEDVEKYKVQLKQILNEMEKINEVDVDGDILISPSNNKNEYREDIGLDSDVDILSNAPKRNGNYIEIKRFVND
ncbi:MAG: Asp-tRNA(Asn)/Glu-tRNA(Gln) amidotransferase subunit GatC [Bacilli bacterium]|nr:Asp-tRNA(Asn)/Glu-tRNA(Gln) amidotransferase subunit GatC [Bacilli bacterium]